MTGQKEAINYYELYKQDSNEITYLTTEESMECFKTGTLRIPYMVSRMWTVKQIGELPTITVNDNSLTDIFEQDILQDIAKPVNALMAVGRVFIVPFLTNKGTYDFDVLIKERDNVTHFEKDEELQTLVYHRQEKIMIGNIIEEKTIYYEHFMLKGAYFFKKYYEDTNGRTFIDGMDGKMPIAKDRMLPFKIDLSLGFDSIAVPIWANAYFQIKDLYNAYTEMLNVMDRLTPIVGIPAMLGERNKVTALGGYSKMFALIPGLKDEMEWKYFGGGYSPDAYIKHMDYILNNISQHCGLGHRALSYDQVTGTAKTATEVTYANNDVMINQALVNQTVYEMLKRLVASFYYIKNNTWLTDKEIEITFEDAIFNTKDAYIEQLKNDILQKNISLDFYLSEIYPNEDTTEIMGEGLYSGF